MPVEDSTDQTPETNPSSDDQVVNQNDIDALFGGGGDASADPPSDASSEESAINEVSQADIDALMNAAGGGADGGADATPASDTPAESSEATPDERTDTLGRPFDEAAAAMQAAIEEEKLAAAQAPVAPPSPSVPPPPPPANSQPVTLTNFDVAGLEGVDANRVTMLNDVNLRVKIQLGKTRMLVEEVLKLGEGSVVELDKLAGDPVDVYVNERLVARGEVLVLNDNFCVRISEVVTNDPHRVVV